jgi:hypothetical protein
MPGKKTKNGKTKGRKPSGGTATYTDGTPLDRIQYLEGKLILKPERFTSVESFREFGRIVQQAANKIGINFISDPKTGLRPEVREIIFLDTTDFRLYNNSYILRRRISYVDGFPVGDPEIVFKFRSADEQKAMELDVRPRIVGKYRVKFKAQALPLKDRIGGYRILYSHNCQFGLSQMHEADRLAMSTIGRVFPALSALKTEDEERVSLVSGAIVEEVLLPLGKIDFTRGAVAKCDVALWRTRGEHMSLVGEFGFQVRFDRREDVSQRSKELCKQFFITLQYAVKDWVALGSTKTGMVYRLKGYKPESDE